MLLALLIVVALGLVVGGVTIVDSRATITDDRRVSLLVSVSGAIAGWVLLDVILDLGSDGLDAWDITGALVGAIALSVLAWRGYRTTAAA